jgi:hypothetical protein
MEQLLDLNFGELTQLYFEHRKIGNLTYGIYHEDIAKAMRSLRALFLFQNT